MTKENNKNIDISNGGILHIFCFDEVKLKDKTTFDACMIENVQVTYWAEDEENIEERFAGMFDILFKEVIKNRDKKAGVGQLITGIINDV